VAILVARSINRMKVVGESPLGMAPTDANRLQGLARWAAADFTHGGGEHHTFCFQTRAAMEKAITYLKGQRNPPRRLREVLGGVRPPFEGYSQRGGLCQRGGWENQPCRVTTNGVYVRDGAAVGHSGTNTAGFSGRVEWQR